ncbi:hypothetical protein [Pseudomonas tohonis]|uniref:hypothetical protein n=1 Tax=Pseudomonas TaxID=286 RepID=UPI0003974E50|nr:hypothetical protein [Pseudomonas tohonis]EQM70953.1 hypothetical protein L682_07265 [Pseudomonas alcaligenes OT 69]MDN4146613.1 hypothetical protein [Pseudomonas tohonis]
MKRYALLALPLAGAVAVLFSLGACSTDSVVGTTAAHLVDSYCSTPALARVGLRAAIATATAPNQIRVECAADAL